MRIDEYGCLITDEAPPGCYGDSCAESCRYNYLLSILDRIPECKIMSFITEHGFIRHLLSPWKENDFSSDQMIPLFLVFPSTTFRQSLENNKWRTGNGDLVPPQLYGLLTGKIWIIKAALFMQSLMFKLPYRWSDSKKWFESTKGSSADYLNFTVLSLYLRKSYMPKEVLKAKILDYYKNEPNSNMVTDLYLEAVDRYL